MRSKKLIAQILLWAAIVAAGSVYLAFISGATHEVSPDFWNAVAPYPWMWWLAGAIGLLFVVWLVVRFWPSRQSVEATQDPSPSPPPSPVPAPRAVISIPGVEKYGPAYTSLNMKTGEHTVRWRETRAIAGRLAPSGNRWDVYDADDEYLGQAQDKREGAEKIVQRYSS